MAVQEAALHYCSTHAACVALLPQLLTRQNLSRAEAAVPARATGETGFKPLCDMT
jgi:hypothetical protein